MGIDLNKRVQTVGIVLAKRGVVAAPEVRVGVSLDMSGSAQGMFRNGTIQETLDRLLAVAVKFDDDGQLDVWGFSNQFGQFPQMNESMYGNYVEQKINERDWMWRGTNYAPSLKAAIDEYSNNTTVTRVVQGATQAATGFFGKLFGSKPAPVQETITETVSKGTKQPPAMLLFVTDGANNDERETRRLLEQAANSNVYFQMVGVGPASDFSFIEQLADDLPNVGFVSMASLNMTDEKLFEELITEEFLTWYKKQPK